MKRIVAFVLAFGLLLGLAGCGSTPAEFGEALEYKKAELIVNNALIYNQEDLLADGYGAMVSALNETGCGILVSFSLKNSGDKELAIAADQISIDYNKGEVHEASMLYRVGANGGYELCQEGHTLAAGAGEAESFVAVVSVPFAVSEDMEAPLQAKVFDKTFTIR